MLSPTMEEGKVVTWNFEEGDELMVGDYLCEVETDKATVGFEMQDDGYLAKILVPEGSESIKLGSPIAIMVEDEGDIDAFKDYKADDAGVSESQDQDDNEEPDVADEEESSK